MSEVREEYTAENYPSFGKKYNGEKAIISLTSWRARINTVSKTLFSLLKQCPGFHIVLVLSEEEFPQKEKELPENLMVFVENELIELLWVYKNYKSFKKVLFTMDKYRDVPVISADDDCIYTCNYAQELYDVWKKNKNYTVIYSYHIKPWYYTFGPATLHSPLNYKFLLTNDVMRIEDSFRGDDDYYTYKYHENGIKIINVHYKVKHPYTTHDETGALCSNKTAKILNAAKKKIGYSEIIKFSL